jgi:hypothetical protein
VRVEPEKESDLTSERKLAPSRQSKSRSDGVRLAQASLEWSMAVVGGDLARAAASKCRLTRKFVKDY